MVMSMSVCGDSWFGRLIAQADLTLPQCCQRSYNADNEDTLDFKYGGRGGRATGMYEPASGLENALLCFTGAEYMYVMLR